MRIKVNSREHEFPPGSSLARVVELVRETHKNDPVTRALIERTGFDHLTFIYNSRIVRPDEYESIELKDGDEIRWMRPYAGGGTDPIPRGGAAAHQREARARGWCCGPATLWL